MPPLGKSPRRWPIQTAIGWALAILWGAPLAGLGRGGSAAPVAAAAKRPPLIVAVERGQRDAVDRLIASGADLEARTPDGVTPLYAAAFHGQTEILRRLIAAGAPVDGRAACGRTPLFTAAAEGRVRAVEALLESGANPSARSDTNELAQTPLHMAALEGQAETARQLLDRGADANARSAAYAVTPLHLARIARHEAVAALLIERGADSSIPDAFGQTPEQAAARSAQRDRRQLLDPQHAPLGFDPRAIVVLPYLGIAEDRRIYRGNSMGVAVGDGSVLVTAAHCVEDFAEADRKAILAKPLVFSLYYGDVFEAEVIGVDSAADIALLQVAWKGHPALPLAGETDLARAREMLVAGYPPPEKTAAATPRDPPQVQAEQLPVLEIQGRERNHQVLLGSARFIGPGWSGSPMIVPGSGRLGGIFGRKNDVTLDDLPVFQIRSGGSVRAIRELMRSGQVRIQDPPAEWGPRAGAAAAFGAALQWLDTQAGRPPREGVAAARAFLQCRPQSAHAHLLLAMSSTAVSLRSPGDGAAAETADQHYRDAARLAPHSFLIHAAFGAHLEGCGRSEDALAQLDHAARIEPANAFVQATRLRILSDLRPAEAVEVGRAMLGRAPHLANGWFHYAGALRKLGRDSDALEAAQTAVRLASPEQFWYRGRLANLLAKAGRFEEAEACYRALLDQRPDSAAFWSWYAQFLAELRPPRPADLRHAIEQCELHNRPPVLPPKALSDLRAALDALDEK